MKDLINALLDIELDEEENETLIEVKDFLKLPSNWKEIFPLDSSPLNTSSIP